MTPDRTSPWLTPRAIVGLLVVAFGVALTLENLGVWPGMRLWRYWPLALVAVGLIKWMHDADRSGRTTGAVLFAIGALISIENFVWRGFDPWRWWPLVIVFFGLMIIAKAIRAGRDDRIQGVTPAGAGTTAGTQPTMSEVAVWSGIERRVTSPAFRRADVTAVMGGIELDLRPAGTEQGEAIVDVFVMWGGVEIKVPPDWAVSNQVSAFMGAVEDKSTGTQQARHRLIVKGVVIMGGVEIKT